jgi:hypothetical protein
MEQFLDGTSKTIAVLEVDDDHAPIWTRPHDMAVDLEKPAAGLGGKHPGIFLAVFVDGHVDSIAQAIDPQVLKALLTRGAGDRANP